RPREGSSWSVPAPASDRRIGAGTYYALIYSYQQTCKIQQSHYGCIAPHGYAIVILMLSAKKTSKKTNRTEYLAPVFIVVAIASVLLGEHVSAWAQNGLTPIFLVGGAGLALATGLASLAHSVRLKVFNLMLLV